MYKGKVEISGLETSDLPTLTEKEKKELLSRAHAGDEAAKSLLVTGNLRLVLSVLRRFSSKKENADDLFQVGCIGLLKAIDKFDLSLDVRFSTYAVPMIVGEIRRYLRDNCSVRVSRGTRDLAYRAMQVREEIAKRDGREVTPSEIARVMGEEETRVSEALEAIVEPMSLYDSVYNDGEDSTYVIDQLSAEGAPDEVWVEKMTLTDALEQLNTRERDIVARRFYKGKTQMEVAADIGISQAQVSRLEKGAIEKMRKYMGVSAPR